MLRASSYFNHVEIGDGRSLLYNGLTLCVDSLPTEYAERLLEENEFSFLSSEEISHLEKRGHITAKSPEDELELFHKQALLILENECKLNKKKSNATLSFILTYKCNLSCGYCYQKSLDTESVPPRMSAEFVDEFFSKYLPQLFPRVPKKNILLLLFGGEPLLPSNRDTIKRILAFARRHSMTVSSPTNAMTLPAMADMVGPGKISNVQVTLDGDQLLHDSQRIPRSGNPTFEATIAAIRKLIERKAYVFIRIHTHPGKVQSLELLIDYLDTIKILGHPNVDIYFAPINDFSSEKGSRADAEAFGRIFQKLAVRTGRPPSLNLDFLDNILGMQSRSFLPRIQFCSLGHETARIVDARGDIYDCYEEAGHLDRRIGTIAGGTLEFFPLKETYAKRHILNIPECLRCPIALFCGGGCARQALMQHGTIFGPHCLQNREFIAQTIKAYYQIRSTTSSTQTRAVAAHA